MKFITEKAWQGFCDISKSSTPFSYTDCMGQAPDGLIQAGAGPGLYSFDLPP